MKSNYLLIDSDGSSCSDNRARTYKSSHKEVSNAVSGGKYQQSSLFRCYTRRFGCTLCNTFRDLKARWRKQQKFERRIRKRNHAFGNETIRVGPPFITSSCTVYIIPGLLVGFSECQRSACGTSAEQSAVYLQLKRPKEYCNNFSLGKSDKARWFLNLPQMRTNK